MKLHGADWNDAMDMAWENGESVAFTCAYAGNMKNIAEYLRKLLLEKQINHQIEVVADMNDLRKLVSEYGKIGSNLNQIAKHFNSGGSQSRAIENEIHQCITDLFLLRKEVLKLAGGMNGNRKTH